MPNDATVDLPTTASFSITRKPVLGGIPAALGFSGVFLLVMVTEAFTAGRSLSSLSYLLIALMAVEFIDQIHDYFRGAMISSPKRAFLGEQGGLLKQYLRLWKSRADKEGHLPTLHIHLPGGVKGDLLRDPLASLLHELQIPARFHSNEDSSNRKVKVAWESDPTATSS